MNDVQFRYMPKQAKWRPVHKDSKGIKATWSRAFAALKYELGRIDAKSVIVEAGYPENRLRNDGWPIANATREHGHVRISFTKNGVPMSFFFGGWVETEQNVYMIALTLKALRAVERYGCAQAGEQYRGWSALPPGGGIAAAEWSSVEEAAKFLCTVAWGPHADTRNVVPGVASGPMLDEVYRRAAKKAHPDVGGSNDLMSKVNRAKDFIEQHGGK